MTDPVIELRLRRVGRSFGVILPKEALEALGVNATEGEKLALVRRPDGSGLELRQEAPRFERKLALLRDTVQKYRSTLRTLAK